MNSTTTRQKVTFGRRSDVLRPSLDHRPFFALGNAAWSYFSSAGTGGGGAKVATLNPPTNVVATFPSQREDGRRLMERPGRAKRIVLDGYYVTQNLDRRRLRRVEPRPPP